MKILFISTLNLATNPRFYKEIMLAKKKGYGIEVICFEFNNWSYSFNKELLKTLGDVPVHLIKGNRKPFFPWAKSVFEEKRYRLEGRVRDLQEEDLSQAVTRRSNLLKKEIDKLKGKFDLVIGHNPGALYPAYYAARKFSCKSGFDVEDYHPGETTHVIIAKRVGKLLQALLPKMDYVTFASTPIKKEFEKLNSLDGETVMNYFPKTEFEPPYELDGNFRMIWFSQNISFDRGLELVIPAIEKLDGVELHLFGNCNAQFKEKNLRGLRNIQIHDALPQKNLHSMLSEFDAGLAIEPGRDRNNELAVSNKIIAYFQAGLYILATDTPGQKEFMKAHPHCGMILSPKYEGFVDKLAQVIASKDSIRRTKRERFMNAGAFNWERESEKLLKVWSSISSLKAV